MKERLAILISGGGTTMEQIILTCQSGYLPIDIACVIASKADAGGLAKAKKLGLPAKDILVIRPQKDKDKFGRELLKALKSHHTTVVTQNGWLPLTPKNVLREYQSRIFNQHPGPLPDFGGKGMYGKRVHCAVLLFRRLTEGEPWTEVIAQRVAEKYDQGAVVKSKKVKILATDTVEDLAQRALPIEHQVQIALLKDFCRNKLKEVPKAPLAKPKENDILNLSKKIACLLYPHG